MIRSFLRLGVLSLCVFGVFPFSACTTTPTVMPEEGNKLFGRIVDEADFPGYAVSTSTAFCARGTATGTKMDDVLAKAKDATMSNLAREVGRIFGDDFLDRWRMAAPVTFTDALDWAPTPILRVNDNYGLNPEENRRGKYQYICACTLSKQGVSAAFAALVPPSPYSKFKDIYGEAYIPADFSGFEKDYVEGKYNFSVTLTERDAYLTVFWISANGTANVVIPKKDDTAKLLRKGERYSRNWTLRVNSPDSPGGDIESGRLIYVFTREQHTFRHPDERDFPASRVADWLNSLPPNAHARYVYSFTITRRK